MPPFIIDFGMGLTGMKLRTFTLVSALGVSPSTMLYINAGTQIASINSVRHRECATDRFVLLGLVPLARPASAEAADRTRRAAIRRLPEDHFSRSIF